jgi:thiamine-phosphate pyrophosphorylase
MRIPARFGFYAILTDPLPGYEECTRILVEADVAFVQLRIKDRSAHEILPIARQMRSITRNTSTRFIINDSPELALQCEADGVHLGQDDMDYTAARALLGPDAIIGISTHSPMQTRDACALQPDYIGVGPVFPTPTKKNPDPVIGIEGMQAMLSEATVPAVAIGGIDFTNLTDVLAAGAANFCMVRQFTRSDNPRAVLEKLKKITAPYLREKTSGTP